MKVYRLARKKYAIELSGKGSAKSNNRWNSVGVEMIYCAESRALAMAEVAVHLSLVTLPSDFVMLEISVPDTLSTIILKEKDLPDEWNIFPHNISTQKVGDKFIQSKQDCILKVPSAVVKGDFNYLINPYHDDFNKIKISKVENFPFDMRIFQSLKI